MVIEVGEDTVEAKIRYCRILPTWVQEVILLVLLYTALGMEPYPQDLQYGEGIGMPNWGSLFCYALHARGISERIQDCTPDVPGVQSIR